MIPQFLRHGAAQFAIGALAAQFGASAQDPTAYCKDHPDETRCVEFLGAGAAFQSRSGNVGSQQTSNVKDAARDNGRYVVFLHTGGAGKDAGEQVAKALRAQGFIVRGTDEQADTVGGAGVDYFSDQDRSGAANAADLANAALGTGYAPLKPRLQKRSNPPGALGVWLKKGSGP